MPSLFNDMIRGCASPVKSKRKVFCTHSKRAYSRTQSALITQSIALRINPLWMRGSQDRISLREGIGWVKGLSGRSGKGLRCMLVMGEWPSYGGLGSE
jgi:hypothetical protein